MFHSRCALGESIKLFIRFFMRNIARSVRKKLEERNQITSRYEPVLNTNKSHRRLIGGLLMPFASRIVGDICFSDMTVGKRFLFGAATYLLVKGSVSFIRKYKFRNWLRARKVKHFKGKGLPFASLSLLLKFTMSPLLVSITDFQKLSFFSLEFWINPQAVGRYSGVPLSLGNFLEDILQPTVSKMAPTSNLGH